MSKRKKIIIIICLIIISLAFYAFKFTETGDYARYFLSVYDTREVESFKKYESDFRLIAKKINTLYDNGEIPKEHDFVFAEQDKMYSGDGNNNSKEIRLTNAEKISLKNIEKTFSGENYPSAVIEIYGNYIVFPVHEYSFGVTYSKNDSVPIAVFRDINKKIKKLAPNWYTVEDKMN